MSIQLDQLTNTVSVNDTVNANSSLNLVGQGTGAVNLKGTGQNLLTQSSTFTNTSAWNTASATITGGQTDPFGGTNASLFLATAQYGWLRELQYNLVNGVTYTLSLWCYVASGTRLYNVVDYNSNILGSFTATTTWTRYSVTFTAVASVQLVVMQDRAASGFINGYIYGAQLEIGSIANTYIPTTTTAIYGTPTLSLSGVAGLGLQSDGSLYVSPAGTGALQAQATTSTATGGNARGANAVDWQTSRSSATQVASGANSFIGSGASNIVSGQYATIVGGNTGQATAYGSFVGAGYGNKATLNQAAVVAGENNTASGFNSFIGGGHLNNATGWFSTIGGGEANSGTSGTAVVSGLSTQTIATGSLQIALTATNANIKPGQLIVATGFPSVGSATSYTYVTSPVVTNTAAFTTASVSTTTLTVTTLASGTVTIGMIIAGLTPSTAYTTAQLTATNTATVTPTCSGTINTNTLTVSLGTGVVVGHFVQPITGIPANTYVVAVANTLITLSQNLTSTITAGTSVSFYTAGQAGTYSLNVSATGTPTGGTSYTFGISQGAIATSQPTITIYTPHGVVVGGGNNTATGSYSFIGGGGDAGTAFNGNKATGDWSTICGGNQNTASGQGAFVGGGGLYFSQQTGVGNVASGQSSAILGGAGNIASNAVSTVLGGLQNSANGLSSIAMGFQALGRSVAYASTTGVQRFSTNGDNQSENFILSTTTTNATTTELTSGGATLSTTTVPVLPAPTASTSSVYTFRGILAAKNTATTDAAGWEIKGVIQRTGSATNTTALVGTPTVTLLGATAGAISAGWGQVANVTVTADTTNGGISVNVTGAAATTIRWNCRLDTTELG